MARKIQFLSDITTRLSQDQIASWNDSCKTSGVVLDNLAAFLIKRQGVEQKKMGLDHLLKSSNPVNELLARQAKIEALQEIIDLIVDK